MKLEATCVNWLIPSEKKKNSLEYLKMKKKEYRAYLKKLENFLQLSKTPKTEIVESSQKPMWQDPQEEIAKEPSSQAI